MQTSDMALKRKVLVDGKELPGLTATSDVKDTEATVEVPGFGRIVEIRSGVKKFEPIESTWKIQRDTITHKFLWDWHYKNENHDVTVVNTDATGEEVNRWLLRDCELPDYNERSYSAAGVEYFGVATKITCPSEPINLME